MGKRLPEPTNSNNEQQTTSLNLRTARPTPSLPPTHLLKGSAGKGSREGQHKHVPGSEMRKCYPRKKQWVLGLPPSRSLPPWHGRYASGIAAACT